uniref:ATP-binding cassette, sub-family A (ABC1), member 2 n=1 Tax=Cyprinus carpio TaxID=7962 RepID=A0A8C2J902_CYPCA
MGFLHQLHLLLWKNVTLKRRGPWVLAFEIFIPLVLFFILLGLRQKKPAIPVKEVCKSKCFFFVCVCVFVCIAEFLDSFEFVGSFHCVSSNCECVFFHGLLCV